MSAHTKKQSLFDAAILRRAILEAVVKLDPRRQIRNPVMFTVYLGSLLTTGLWIAALRQSAGEMADKTVGESPWFILSVAVWLWFTVLFANFAEAMAEGRGKAQADALRRSRTEVPAKRLCRPLDGHITERSFAVLSKLGVAEVTPASALRAGDVVLVEAGDYIPADGEVLEGIASVDESAITGESAPVIREGGGDRSGVTGGTRVLSDWLVVRITVNPGEAFLDRMIAMVEGAKRQKTPNEIALDILLAGMTLIFLLVCVTLLPMSVFSVESAGRGTPVTVTVLAALLVCLIPTTIGGLLSAIGIAGMDRMIQANVIAMSGRAVEAAGDVNVLLLDKTGTITLGNRQAVELVPANGVEIATLADAAQLASLADETPEGRSIVVLAKTKYGLRGRDVQRMHADFIPFAASTRISGVNCDGRQIRKGAYDAIESYVGQRGSAVPPSVKRQVEQIAKQGGTPLLVAESGRVLGVIHLKDIVKGGIRERFAQMRQMGIKTVMITGDNPLTAAAIAAEAGVDDFFGRSDARGQARLDPATPGGRSARGDDRRRHERLACLGPGRRGRGDEHRHAGGQRGGQHGRPRLESHQTDRDRRDRQATFDDPRRADHVQSGQ